MLCAVAQTGVQPEFRRACRRIPVLQEAWKSYRELVEEIVHQVSRTTLDSTGATGSKASLRATLATAASRISAGLVTWAEDHGQLEVAHAASLTRSTLLRGRGIEASLRASGLLTLAQAHQAGLRDYGIGPARLHAFAELVEQFAEAVARPRSIIVERKLAKLTLTRLLAEADDRLGRLDRLTSILADDRPDLVAAYRASRRLPRTSAIRDRDELQSAIRPSRNRPQAGKTALPA